MCRVLMSLAAAAALCAPGLSHAGVFADGMAKCLVGAADEADRKTLVIWIFSGMSAHPDVAAYATITPAQRDDFNQRGAAMMQRLLLTDCRTETVAALKNEGAMAFHQAFGVLGEVAMDGLMEHEAVSRSMQGLAAAVDQEKLTALFAEAGIVFKDEAEAN